MNPTFTTQQQQQSIVSADSFANRLLPMSKGFLAVSVTVAILILFALISIPTASTQIMKANSDVTCSCECNPLESKGMASGDLDKMTAMVSSERMSSSIIASNVNRNATAVLKTANSDSKTKLPYCSSSKMQLVGPLDTSLIPNITDSLSVHEVMRQHTTFKVGGHWKPSDCTSRQKVAVIVPFRDRHSHLSRLLLWLTPVLQKQLLEFFYVVVEQYGNDLFNKGRIMNAAFLFAEENGANCMVFHDVDMLPADDRVMYRCDPRQPVHLGAYVDSLGYRLRYDYLVGGVLAITPAQFRKVNGFSAMYWGWGGEDDDMGYRLKHYNFTIQRPPNYAKFTMLSHKSRERISYEYVTGLLMFATNRIEIDGLRQQQKFWRSLGALSWPMYYHLYVDVGEPPAYVMSIISGHRPED